MEGRRVTKSLVSMLPFLLLFHGMCESDVQVAPMEKTEQEALYLMIQGFVGQSWNGSGLYPDPCGWTPIQVLAYDIFLQIFVLFYLVFNFFFNVLKFRILNISRFLQ